MRLLPAIAVLWLAACSDRHLSTRDQWEVGSDISVSSGSGSGGGTGSDSGSDGGTGSGSDAGAGSGDDAAPDASGGGTCQCPPGTVPAGNGDAGVPDAGSAGGDAGMGSDGGSDGADGSGGSETCSCPDGTVPIVDQGATHCWPAECQSDVDCPAGVSCVAGTCHQPACASDSDCPAPETCSADGTCVEPSCDACPAEYHCDANAGLGVPDHCDEHTECPWSMACMDGTCMTNTGVCDSNADCASDHCELVEESLGWCFPMGSCTSDDACPLGQRCETGVCTTLPADCTNDAECAPGWCDLDSGTCMSANGCVADADCVAASERCISKAPASHGDVPLRSALTIRGHSDCRLQPSPCRLRPAATRVHESPSARIR